MFVDFEGIDGSGKTTLSNRVARRLRSEGIEVIHAREGGELPCEIARRIRSLTRDAASLELEPMAELLLYCARDARVIDAVIRPSVGRGTVVLADRYLHSHLALAVAGRGLPEEVVRPVLDSVAQGLWPDLVVVVDVDPELARLRKRASRLGMQRDEESGRKGLSGTSFQERIRRHFLEQAEADRGRFLVLRNDQVSIDALEEQVVAAILGRRSSAAPKPVTHRPAPRVQRFPSSHFDVADPDRRVRLLGAFFDRARALARDEPATAALFLGEADGEAAWTLRAALSLRAPAAVIRAVADRRDDRAMELREALLRDAPLEVARSLEGHPGPRAAALRNALAEPFPMEVAEGLEGLDDEAAWELRGRLWPVVPEAVLASLAGLDGARAWSLRRDAIDREIAIDAIVASLACLDGARACALREELGPKAAPLAQIRGVRGCTSDAAWQLRERWLHKAPKPVLKGLFGLDHERAWPMRQQAGAVACEALDSIAGMRGQPAAVLRRELAPVWPASVLRSLPRPLSPEDEAFLWEIVAAYGGHPSVLRAAALCLEPEET